MMKRTEFLGEFRIFMAPFSFLAVTILVISGCNDSGTMQTAAATTDPGGCLALDQVSFLSGTTATTCCANGNAISPAPSGCPAAPAGITAVTDSLNNGAAATAAGNGGTTTAVQLASDSTAGRTTPGSQMPGSLAALAGGVLRAASLNDGPLHATPGTAGVPITTLNSMGSGAPGTGSGGNTGGLGSGFSLNGGAGNAAVGLAGVGGVSGASGADSSNTADAGAYGAGAGGMGSGTNGAGMNGSQNDNTNGSSQTGNSLNEFNNGRDLASESPTMGTADPSDYFTRLGVQDDIFKIVERRYLAKSKQWALVDATVITKSVSKPIHQQP